MRRSSRDRVALGLGNLLGTLALLGGAGCVFLISRSGWWAVGAVVLLPVSAWLLVLQSRAERDLRADEALDAAAEYDRTHPPDAPASTERDEH